MQKKKELFYDHLDENAQARLEALSAAGVFVAVEIVNQKGQRDRTRANARFYLSFYTLDPSGI